MAAGHPSRRPPPAVTHGRDHVTRAASGTSARYHARADTGAPGRIL